VPAANRRIPQSATWLIILSLLAIISLSCDFGIKPREPVGQEKPAAPAGFEQSDCSVAGVTFSDITVDYIVDEMYAGPYLTCNSSSASAHGSIQVYISITAYKADKLGGFFQNTKTSIQSYVDQSTEWNANPEVPDEAKDVISMIHDDSNRYVFMITSEANVQNCFNGYGYGIEVVNGKYLVNIHYLSCELADTAAYVAMLESVETAALTAIQKVEGASNP
jgi:hypothetical protein